jgi:hypothetical protein
MRSLSALIVDDNEDELRAMKTAFGKLFAFSKIQVEIQDTIVTIEDLPAFVSRHVDRPDIVIVDNQLDREKVAGKSAGQETIARMKKLLPDGLFILMTKEEFKEGSFGSFYPHPDILVSKAHLENIDSEHYVEYKDWLSNEITHRLRRSLVGEIDQGDAAEELSRLHSRPATGKRKRITQAEIRSLIEQACHTGGPINDNEIDGVKLKLLHGGKSDAVVCLIFVRNKFGEYQVPAVIKFLDRASARREALNHAKYVKWTLPYRWRVDVIGSARTNDFGAVSYSFAHGGSGAPVTLSEFLEDDDRKLVSEVLSSVFSKDSNCWYSTERTKEEPLGVYLSKQSPYFVKPTDWTKREQGIADDIKSLESEAGLNVIINERVAFVQLGTVTIDVSSPAKLVSGYRGVPQTSECLSHGDLNAANILISKGSEDFCFIDFQHTGWHHRARDFCSIEGSIRTLQIETENVSFAERVTSELDRWRRAESGCLLIGKSEDLIDEARWHFFNNHSDATVAELAVASLVHNWWLLSFPIWNDYQRRRLLAGFLGCIGWLQHSKNLD